MATVRLIFSVVGIFLAVWLLLIQDYLSAAITKLIKKPKIAARGLKPVKTSRRESGTARRPDKYGEVLSLVSFACTIASWGWTVVAPDSSATFGSVLLGVAIVLIVIALLRLWPIKKLFAAAIIVIAILGFSVFDWYIILKPQKGKEFKALLIDGYHISHDCSEMPAKNEMPEWLRDRSKEWQAQVEQRLIDKLDYKDLQVWANAVVLGRVKDVNMNAYQCMWDGRKLAALETIVASHYDAKLLHRDYSGPLYYLNASNGEVDISEAMKNGQRQADIYIDSNGASGPIKVTGKGGDQSK